MRYWLGLIMFTAGAWMIMAALAQRRRVLELRRQREARGLPATVGSSNMSLTILGEVVPPIIVFALVVVGAKMTLAYFVMDAGRWLSVFDLAGFLFLLAGYGTWIMLKTRYRVSASAPVDRSPIPSTLPAGSED
jgi:hypothetical protein